MLRDKNQGFFSIRAFFHAYSQFTRQQGKGKAISLAHFDHFHRLHRHLDISRVITAHSQQPLVYECKSLTTELRAPDKSQFMISGHCKPTFSGIFSHFDGFVPSGYKFNLASTLILRGYSICCIMELSRKGIFLRNNFLKKVLQPIVLKKILIFSSLVQGNCRFQQGQLQKKLSVTLFLVTI